MLITLYKIGRVLFRLLATNGFRVKAKKERITAASSQCRQNLKYEKFPSSFGRLRQNIAPKSVLHMQHDYFSSFNQSNHWFVVLSLMLPSSDLKLPINYMMLIHESNVFGLHVELKFEVCDPFIIFNTTYVVTRKAWKVQARTALKPWPWLIINPHNDKLPVGLITQLVKHCTAITEVSISIKFRPSSKLHKWH